MSPLQFWLSALLLSHLNFNSCFFLALSTVLCLPRVFLVWNACFILPFLHLRSFLCSIRCLAAQSTMSHFESFGLPAPVCYVLLCPFVCCIMSWLGCFFCGWVVRKPLLSAMLSFVLCFLTFLSVMFFPFAVVLWL